MTKQSIAIITDSTATLSESFIKEHDIHVVPLYVIFGDQCYRENIDITAQQFYDKLANEKELPKTSQPALGEMLEMYEELKKTHDYVIAIHATSALTGAYESSVLAAEQTGVHAFALDSKLGSFPLGQMVERAVAMRDAGYEFADIVNYLKTFPDKARLFITPGSLEQLHKGGRVTGTQSLLANLLNLKVILAFENGRAILAEKVRSQKKAMAKIEALLNKEAKYVKKVSVLHAADEKGALSWREKLQQVYPTIEFSITEFSPVPGAHTGRGTLGLTWLNE